MLHLEITDPSRLDEISGEIHDWFYDLDDVAFDPARAEIVIPFRRWSYHEARPAPPRRGLRWLAPRVLPAWEAPWYRWFLRVGAARRHRVLDEAGIGVADFDGIAFDAARGRVVITGNIPVTIEVEVDRLALAVEASDVVLGAARYRAADPAVAISHDGTVHPARDA